ncbi:hypothetical protein EMIHUDRAFT_456617 [Emiliania huxleyi CCMP1516]|uniref:Pre-mRNA-splicing factor 38 n=2 Tax=Emiliania huxleyi TaxID=2903 RepID=A0A0D3K3M0_EMIH1|nr:hypothetical protein EMIHUDRAFT_456617 [Emiliania huxleyi CCMP1516]EOD30355.1 hypothetical protein EMIHUDRAFT_456617 [Emiliania huxleyi CCMP1516]|eukprot:XP_005782784.1 hypothetical protein EMIHUDRAFT_456617 [Emiliania huxleyi CCMP1516]
MGGRHAASHHTGDPAGGNRTQEYAEPNEEGPHEADVVPLVKIADPVHGAPAFNINPMLLEGIRMGDRFWELAKLTTFGEVVDAIFYEVKYVTPWVPGTHGKRSSGMQSAVRGVSNAGTPGIAYTMLLKLFLLRLTRDQVRSLLRHPDSPYIRAIGFLYLRLGLYDFKELWAWFQPYLGDDDQFFIDGTPATATTIGEFDFFGDRLPRLPVLVSRQIEDKLQKAASGVTDEPPTEAGGGGGGSGWGPEDAERLKRKRAELAEAEGKVRSLRKLLSEREAQAARR